jgi:hypothetical protein
MNALPVAPDWNVIVTLPEATFREARNFLRRWGKAHRTAYFRVLTLTVNDPERFLQEIAKAIEESPGILNLLSHVIPAQRTFDFASAEEFEAAARDIAILWAPALAAKSFHVRLHRRGFKGLLSTAREERFLDETLLDALAAVGQPGRISFSDPDAILQIETIDGRAVDAAAAADVETAVAALRAVNSRAPITYAASPVNLDYAAAVRGKRVLIIEDGPTITHGEMGFGAGFVAATTAGAAAIIDPRETAAPQIEAVFKAYPHIGNVLPAVGYSAAQLEALAATVNASAAEVVVSATPIDLAHLAPINKKIVRARYNYAEIGTPALSSFVDAFLERLSDADTIQRSSKNRRAIDAI